MPEAILPLPLFFIPDKIAIAATVTANSTKLVAFILLIL